MKKVSIFLLFIVTVFTMVSFFEAPREKVNWISAAQLSELYAKEPRPILFDVYTDWCGWCKQMDRTTYQNKKLVTYINEHYYAVKLDAESTDSIQFNKVKYGYNKSYKANELAAYLLADRMEFPTTVFLPEINAQPAPLAGYMNAKEMEAPLKFFAEGAFRKQTFVEFNKNFKSDW
jgi:thioredoxin-related protein